MDFSLTEEQEKLRDEIEAFCKEHITDELIERTWGVGEPHSDEFYQELIEHGYMGLGWPEEYGGKGKDRLEMAIFRSVLDNYEAPMWGYGPTVGLVAQSLMRYGSEEQKKEFLTSISRGEILCCMGITEPDAGSDAAAIQLRAVEDEGEYVLNGSKIFITGAEVADYVLTVARTNPDVPKHKGASLFLVSTKLPGLTIRPMETMGRGQTNEIIFEDVRVPASMMVGEKDMGWMNLRETFAMERVGLGGIRNVPRLFDELVQYCKETMRDGKLLIESESVRRSLAEMKIRIRVAQLMYFQAAWLQSIGENIEVKASFSKQFSAELYQFVMPRAMEIIGIHGQARRGDKYAVLKGGIELLFRHCPAMTIGGGTTQIQRNLQAQRGLGLPRK
jgi:alkylation response protein AidB-like acyl-CoA dehydrogenase